MRKAALVLFLAGLSCSRTVAEPEKSDFAPSEGTPLPPGPKELQITDDVVGTGAEAKSGDNVAVHYTGTLMNGRKFDSSRDKNKPFDFKIGGGQVIKGWDQGVVGMKVGGKRRLVIPSDLGYGAGGHPPDIPPNAGLKFEVELMDVKK
jgi:FKBP-type peptidyl-prolyl cis-trans isomerase